MPPKTRSKDTIVVNFRITTELHNLLMKYAETMQDDCGQLLTPGLAARKIVVANLRQLESQITPEEDPVAQ